MNTKIRLKAQIKVKLDGLKVLTRGVSQMDVVRWVADQNEAIIF